MSLDYHPCSEEQGVIPYPDKGMSLVLGGADTLVAPAHVEWLLTGVNAGIAYG